MNRVARASSSIILSGTCLVGSLGVGSTSANGNVIVNEVVKKDENAVQAIKRVIKDLEQNGEAALGSANIVLNSLKNSLHILLEKVYTWFSSNFLRPFSSDKPDLVSLHSENELNSVNEIVKKVDVVQEIIVDQKLSGKEKVLKVKEALVGVLKDILEINSTDIVVNDVNTTCYEAYISDNDGKALGGISISYDKFIIDSNKNKTPFLDFEFKFSNGNMFLDAQNLALYHSNPILHVVGLDEQEERLAFGSVMLLNVLLGYEIRNVCKFAMGGNVADGARTMGVIKDFRAWWIKKDMQRLCATSICVSNIINLADSLKNRGKLSAEQIKEFEKLGSTYYTIVEYWRKNLKDILDNRYNEEKIGYVEGLKPVNFKNNNYKEEQEKDDSVFSELENKLRGLIGEDLY